MKTEKGDWVKVKILKHMISLYGSHFPGDVVTIPLRVARNWAKLGIAEGIEDLTREVPAGTFWCLKHQTAHQLDSSPGKRCLKHQTKEAIAEGEAQARAAVEAMERAKAAAVAEEAEEAEVTGDGTGEALLEISDGTEEAIAGIEDVLPPEMEPEAELELVEEVPEKPVAKPKAKRVKKPRKPRVVK